jgi:glycosyltransferase involved in cell wall biosynthesis
MRFVFLSHNYSSDVILPAVWIDKIRIYSGSLEILSRSHQVIRVEQINYQGKYIHNGVEYHFVNYKKRKSYVPWRLHRLVKNLNPDIVIVHGLHYPLQTILLRLRLGKIPKIVVQNHAEKPFTGPKKYLQRLADHFVQGYFFASTEMGTVWVHKGNLASVSKIHEVMEVSSVFAPVSKENARSKTGAKGSPIYLWVGRLNQNKDPLTVVKAFLQFASLHPAAKLYMIFHTEELLPQIRQLVEQNARENDSVEMVGKVPHEELLYWYNSADFLVSGSHFEGSGTAVCEAMSCGCVPVVTDIFSFRMMTDNGTCGFLYRAGSEEDLLKTLKQTLLIDIGNEKNKILERFRKKLSFEAIASRIEEVATTLLAGRI